MKDVFAHVALTLSPARDTKRSATEIPDQSTKIMHKENWQLALASTHRLPRWETALHRLPHAPSHVRPTRRGVCVTSFPPASRTLCRHRATWSAALGAAAGDAPEAQWLRALPPPAGSQHRREALHASVLSSLRRCTVASPPPRSGNTCEREPDDTRAMRPAREAKAATRVCMRHARRGAPMGGCGVHTASGTAALSARRGASKQAVLLLSRSAPTSDSEREPPPLPGMQACTVVATIAAPPSATSSPCIAIALGAACSSAPGECSCGATCCRFSFCARRSESYVCIRRVLLACMAAALPAAAACCGDRRALRERKLALPGCTPGGCWCGDSGAGTAGDRCGRHATTSACAMCPAGERAGGGRSRNSQFAEASSPGDGRAVLCLASARAGESSHPGRSTNDKALRREMARL